MVRKKKQSIHPFCFLATAVAPKPRAPDAKAYHLADLTPETTDSHLRHSVERLFYSNIHSNF
jgi:hypothetical protein